MAADLAAASNELEKLVEEARSRRLTKSEEQEGVHLLRDLILAGGKATNTAVALSPTLPWQIQVTGTTEAWPQLSAGRKKSFLAALRHLDSEPSRRMRLSLARGLYRADPLSALRLLITSLSDQDGFDSVGSRDRQTFANVLLGKNKPWIVQVNLAQLRAPEAKLLARYALMSCGFTNPPFALSLLRWTKDFTDLASLPDSVSAEIARAVRRWSPRWLKELAKEKLSLEISRAVQERLGRANAPESTARQKPEKKAGPPQISAREEEKPREDRAASEPEATELTALFRPIEARFAALKAELANVRRQLRTDQRASSSDPSPSPSPAKAEPGLRIENARLREEIEQLRQTLNELAEDRFTEAISRETETGLPVSDPIVQFKSYLQAVLREEIGKYKGVNRENRADGMPLLLENILQVLEKNGIEVLDVEAPPSSVRRRY
jgi:hypothetical protein